MQNLACIFAEPFETKNIKFETILAVSVLHSKGYSEHLLFFTKCFFSKKKFINNN